jgi:hypothetical protein
VRRRERSVTLPRASFESAAAFVFREEIRLNRFARHVALLSLAIVAGCGARPRQESAAVAPDPTAAPAAGVTHATAAAASGAAARAAQGFDASLAPGIALFQENRMPEALASFRGVALRRPKDPDAHAWAAEAARRAGEYDNAVKDARAALALDPRHAFAHDVLGEAYMPQYGWDHANADSGWAHLRAALDCDPSDGNPALSVWIEALRRGDRDAQARALKVSRESGFLPPALMSFARWSMKDLPPRAIYVVSGDALSHAAIALQAGEGYRPDVTIVIAALLDAPWYRRLVTGSWNVTNPFGGDTLERVVATMDSKRVVTTPSQRITERWAVLAARGRLGRPYTVSTTVPEVGFAVNAGARLALRGAYWEVGATGGGGVPFAGLVADTAAIRASLRSIDPAAIRGDMVHPRDRSRSRWAAPDRLRAIPIVTAGVLGRALFAAGRRDEARSWLPWMERFEKEIGSPPHAREQVEQYRSFLASGK